MAGTSSTRVSGLRFVTLGAALVCATAMTSGCQNAWSPLATRDAFFASPSSSVERPSSEVDMTLGSGRGLLELQRACGAADPTVDSLEDTGVSCDRRAPRFFGRRAAAYRRWVEDQVRELPEPAATASSAGG